MQAVRSWCDVPVATLTARITPQQLEAIAEAFQREGRSLWLADTSPQSIVAISPALKPTLLSSGKDAQSLPETIERPPENYSLSVLSIYAAQVRGT